MSLVTGIGDKTIKLVEFFFKDRAVCDQNDIVCDLL